ncbi:hypothetical protein [Gemmobacter serpentinus]|uniref:hypothetical protein n=1 Tax=Gemmobacter serpentinus TaxID=2652247 RepID=UPI00124BE178|nr:hypothetical protein [Gemmobacter serpentinus]
MKAWAIFVHSIRQVFGNLPEALHVSGLLYLVQLAVAVGLGVTPGSIDPTATDITPDRALAVLVVVLVMLVCTLWIAVSWHRFVLLGERPNGYIPAFNLARIADYGAWSLLIGLVVVALAAVVFIAASILLVSTLGQQPVAAWLAMLITIVAAFAVLYRLSTALPGVALNRKTGFADGWVATTGETQTVLILAFFTGLIGIVLSTPLSLMSPGSMIAMLWELATGWVQLMVSASILTTLYGHYIEKRPLV